jgi:hypothetical protein
MPRRPRVRLSTFVKYPLRALVRICVCAGTLLLLSGVFAAAQAQVRKTVASSSNEAQYSRIVLGPIPMPPGVTSQAGGSGPGLTIIPIFDASIDAATQTVIKNVIAYFQKTFSTNITLNIEFHNMNSGLGQSTFFIFTVPYSTYRTALGNHATSSDDATALANTPGGSINPVNGAAIIDVKSPVGRALGLNTPEQSFNVGGSPCPNFTGSGCIGLDIAAATGSGILKATVEHEIDEILGLGSALEGTTTPADPWTNDLFRWTSAGSRSFKANRSNTNPCSNATPAAFLSFDDGATNLDQFNNCANGGDYGDWVTHTPSQVQDAFTDGSADPSLLVDSPEIRTLDVMGYNIAFKNFADKTVWRPSNGTWYVIPRDNPNNFLVQQWGVSGDIPVPGDYDGDGKVDFAVWRPSNGTWYVIPSGDSSNFLVQQWGVSGDIPVPGDYDGDGITDFAVYRPSTGQWFVIPSSNPGTPLVQQWGVSGDIPVPGDYDGDRKTDFAVWRPSNGTWYVTRSGTPNNFLVQQWGLNGDTPVPGDYDGDGTTDFAVWRPSNGTWYVTRSGTPNNFLVQQWGLNGDTPVPGDYDGDGTTDFAVWRPSNGTWYVIPSSAPANFAVTQWGINGDVPTEKPLGQ